ncbi:hypothetical protein VTN77DRAFT_2343 [Rasamsonia byssochlamydoides]|uniref:uncharacterized protein n=1 Tax=Rasamsonia byssochlamydoides TaxID=89139 RepID=UPI0037435316
MQGLWSRAAQSSSTCRCVSCLSTAASGVTSRTTTAAARRRLRLGNAVTALYSSIFAGAALADAKAKDKRRHEWEQKIAAVKEEVNQLVDEENRILEALASRRARQQNAYRPLQTRRFSTTTPRLEISQAERYGVRESAPLDAAGYHDQVPDDPNSSSSDLEDPLFDYAENTDEEGSRSDRSFPWATGDILRIKAIQKLALKQLAIRFMLRPVIAHNYSGLPMDYAADFSLPQFSASELLNELNSIRRRIRALKYSEDEPFDDLAQDIHIRQYQELRAQRDKLDAELQNDINLYLNKQMSLPELLLRISNNLISGEDPDRPRAFQLMIMAFTKTRQNDLVDLVLRAVIPNLFELTTPLIVSTLTYFRKSKNLKDFDQFLQMLRGEGYPVNLRSMTLYEKKVINGVEITVPPQASCNPVIYGTLIAAALRFDQADRAEAWLQAWRATGFLDNFSTLCAFLRFYTVRKDWDNGLYTLLRALAFMTSSISHPEKRIERLIVHMVHFCDSCGQEDVAATLIDAAVHSGFDWKVAFKQRDISSEFDPTFQRWRRAAEAAGFTSDNNKTILQKCHEFTALVTEKITKLTSPEGDSFVQLRQAFVRNYSKNVLSTTFLDSQRKAEINHSNHVTDSTDVNPASGDVRSLDENDSSGLPRSSTSVAAGDSNEEIQVLQEEVARLRRIVEGRKNKSSTGYPARGNTKGAASKLPTPEVTVNGSARARFLAAYRRRSKRLRVEALKKKDDHPAEVIPPSQMAGSGADSV